MLPASTLLQKQVHECKEGTMDVTSFFNKLSLIWQEMDLYGEIVWDCLYGGVRYFRIGEVDLYMISLLV